jgi:DNA-binding MarR family transcriptional regulator
VNKVPETGADSLGVTVALRELAWTVHHRAPERAGSPIPTTELLLLRQVIETPGATVSELAQELGLQQTNTSAALRVLERRGYITRGQSSSDRRVVRILATPVGEREERDIAAAWSGALEPALRELSDEHRSALIAAVDALHAINHNLRTGF